MARQDNFLTQQGTTVQLAKSIQMYEFYVGTGAENSACTKIVILRTEHLKLVQ